MERKPNTPRATQAAVGNAEDPEQVQRAAMRDKLGRQELLDDMAALLEQPPFRRVAWHLLEKGRAFHSVMGPPGQIEYNAGWQDSAHYLFALINEASDTALVEMMREHLERQRHG